MANTTDTKHLCAECGYNPDGFCRKTNLPAHASRYACNEFKTREQLMAEFEEWRKRKLDREETRLNFILTAIYISAASTQQLLEYFDKQFQDRKAESDWRFKRAQAASEIIKAAERIRNLYQHNFMHDQTRLMTAHGSQPFDWKAYDNHEDDARLWSLKLLYDLDRCWQNEDLEQQTLQMYIDLPDNGIFDQKDYRHFTPRK